MSKKVFLIGSKFRVNLLRSFKSSNIIQKIKEGGVGGCKVHLSGLGEDLTKSVLL